MTFTAVSFERTLVFVELVHLGDTVSQDFSSDCHDGPIEGLSDLGDGQVLVQRSLNEETVDLIQLFIHKGSS